jgi:hypothetical protein
MSEKTIEQLTLAAQELASAAKRLDDLGMVGDDGPLRSTFYDIEIAQTVIAGHAGQMAADDVMVRCGVDPSDEDESAADTIGVRRLELAMARCGMEP